jgi:phenylacetate-CoA ligase
MIWNEAMETMDQGKMKKLQSERLIDLVSKVYKNVPFYKKKMDDAGVKPSDIESIDDIVKLPFTSKTEMRDTYPYGLLATAPDQIVEVHTSSGTTGTPVVDAYTLNDLEVWSEVMARCLAMGDATKEDTIQNAYGYGLFTGGLGVHYGARKIRANLIPISGGNTQRQLKILQDFRPTILTCTPSYSLLIAEMGKESGIDFSQLALRVGIFGAEPWSEAMRIEIQEKLHIQALDIYGLTEIIGPGVSCECSFQDGMHICEDHFYPEVIDPETGNLLPDGEKGELVFTTITKEGTPIVRYRTRDITYLMRGKCRCGRASVRMHRVLGRTDDMLIIRGVNVFPSQIEEVLMRIEGIEPHYLIIVDRESHMDTIEVQVEMNERLFSDEIRNLEKAEKTISEQLYAALNIHALVKLVDAKSIPRSEGKAKRVIDKRKI